MASGDVSQPGSPTSDPISGSYAIAAGGTNAYSLAVDLGSVVSVVVDATTFNYYPSVELESPSGHSIWYADEDRDGIVSVDFVSRQWQAENNHWSIHVYGAEGDQFDLDVLVTPFNSLVDFDYAYDDGGNLLTAADSLGATTTYTYDAVYQLDTIIQTGTGADSKSVDFNYLDDGQLLRIQRHSNATFSSLVVTTDYDQYDDIGRLKILKHTFDDNPARSFNYDYAYDAASRITQVNSADGTDDFGYDNTHQLTSAGHFYQTDESYGYDDNGNRDTGGFTVDDNNRMDSDGTYTYAYDGEGNRTTRTAADNSQVVYTWDHRNRLTKVTFNDTGGQPIKEINYTYDYQNRLVERDVTVGTADHAYYVHQGDNIALELDGLQSGDLTHRYLWGAAVDQLLADDQRGGELLWTLGDHEQTIRSVIDNTGRIRIYRRYDSYGQITQEFKYDASGNIIPDTHAEAVDELFAYTGRMLDKDTGNQKHGQRWYDPPTGGWLSEDPSGFNAGDMNLYRYVGNNPVNYVDPSGLDWSGFSSFMPGFQDYGSTSSWQTSGSVPRVDPPSQPSLFDMIHNSAQVRSRANREYERSLRESQAQKKRAREAWNAQLRRDFDSDMQSLQNLTAEPTRSRMTQAEAYLQMYETNPLMMFDSGDWFRRLQIQQDAIAQPIRNSADQLGNFIETTGIHTGSESIAAYSGYLGQNVRTVGGLAGGIVDFPGAVGAMVSDLGETYRVSREHGILVGGAHMTGMRQAAEWGVGVDIMTYEPVDPWAKAQEGLFRFSGTMASVAGGLKITGLGRPKPLASVFDDYGVAPSKTVTSGGTANAASGARLNEHLTQLQKYGKDGFKQLENGRYRYYGNVKPARTPGEMSGARLAREWDPTTGNTRTWVETLDHSGRVRSVAPKPVTHPANHHIFDANGTYQGRR